MHQQIAELTERVEPLDDDTLENGMRALAALRRRNAELERLTNDAIIAVKSRDVEIQNLRLQVAERDNRLVSLQSSIDERLREYQAERDFAVTDAAELRAVFMQIKHLFETKFPLPRVALGGPKSAATGEAASTDEAGG